MSNAHLVMTVALLTAACSASVIGPPEIVEDRTICSHCGMLVSEPSFAAAYQLQGAEPRIFDDIGCMLAALQREAASPATAWVQDATGSGWINADEATFVASTEFRTPMGGGVLAYADRGAARKAATAHRGRVLSSRQELQALNGEGR